MCYIVEIQPLTGKYYGTRVKITKNEVSHFITIWNNEIAIPSSRVLDSYGILREEWINNSDIFYMGEYHKAQDLLEMGSHIETEISYQLALDMKESLEGYTTLIKLIDDVVFYLKLNAYSTVERLIKNTVKPFLSK